MARVSYDPDRFHALRGLFRLLASHEINPQHLADDLRDAYPNEWLIEKVGIGLFDQLRSLIGWQEEYDADDIAESLEAEDAPEGDCNA